MAGDGSAVTRFADTERLLRVAKATRNDTDRWREGIFLEGDTGHTLDELRDRATADRLDLARRFLRRAERMVRLSPPLYRDAVSRLYYSMYHAWRALVFFTHGGDDYEKHSELSLRSPPGFPNEDVWKNRLKVARLERNKVDYDAYPKGEGGLGAAALQLEEQAAELLRLSRAYLRSRGCRYL